MERRCEQWNEALIDLAEGKPSPEAEAHVAACPTCEERLAQYTIMFAASRVPQFDPPESVKDRAKALMGTRRRAIGTLVRSSLAGSHARRTPGDFQVIVQAGEHRIRLMYERRRGGWHVIGRMPSEAWSVRAERSSTEDGGFIVTANQLEGTGFTLVHGDDELVIPPGSEFLGS
jgi:hypothetical protein